MSIKHNPNLKPKNFDGLLTLAPEMLQFMEKVQRVAATQASILVRGKTGTGKDLVARYMHNQSARKNAQFNAINCAALTGELMASELFGHKKGAFTGAYQDRKGILELTDGGTLFLDEIAEMPLDIQARLLRVIQDRSYTPLGSSQTKSTDIRLISATHQSLRQHVQNKQFREDLMYRIRVIPLFIPALIERSGDVEMLLWHFIEQLNQTEHKQITSFESKPYDALLSYHWPGNIRELQNVAQFIHAMSQSETVTCDDLPDDITGKGPSDEQEALPFNQMDERQRLLVLLQKHQNKKQPVADELGISRATLWRRLKSYGLG